MVRLDVLTVTGPDWDNIPHPCLPGFHLPSHHQQLLTTIAEIFFPLSKVRVRND